MELAAPRRFGRQNDIRHWSSAVGALYPLRDDPRACRAAPPLVFFSTCQMDEVCVEGCIGKGVVEWLPGRTPDICRERAANSGEAPVVEGCEVWVALVCARRTPGRRCSPPKILGKHRRLVLRLLGGAGLEFGERQGDGFFSGKFRGSGGGLGLRLGCAGFQFGERHADGFFGQMGEAIETPAHDAGGLDVVGGVEGDVVACPR